jgi:hypothetical protein
MKGQTHEKSGHLRALCISYPFSGSITGQVFHEFITSDTQICILTNFIDVFFLWSASGRFNRTVTYIKKIVHLENAHIGNIHLKNGHLRSVHLEIVRLGIVQIGKVYLENEYISKKCTSRKRTSRKCTVHCQLEINISNIITMNNDYLINESYSSYTRPVLVITQTLFI